MIKTNMFGALDTSIRTLMIEPEKKIFFLTTEYGIKLHWATCDVAGTFVLGTLALNQFADFICFEQRALSIELSSDTSCILFPKFNGSAEFAFELFGEKLKKLLRFSNDQILEAKYYTRSCFFPYKYKEHAERIRIVPILIEKGVEELAQIDYTARKCD